MLGLLEGQRLDRVLEPLALGEVDQFPQVVERPPDARHEAGLAGDCSEAERDAAAEQADRGDEPLAVDEPRRRGEGLVRGDEVEHDVERPFELLGGRGDLGPELQGALPLLRRDVASPHRGV